ncbi:MAG TPA: PepSY-like domain-containing protein [Chitinophagaceae bacterium]
MKLKNCLIAVICAALFASCGENSSNKDNDKDTVVTVAPPPDNTPTNVTVVVPEPTQTAFKTRYPAAASITWKRYEPVDRFDWTWAGWPVMDTADYWVTYTDDGVEYWTWYDENNNWIGTSSEITNHSSLPAAVSKAVTSNFPGYTITSVSRENDKDRTAYEIKLEKGADKAKLLVDENGRVIKKTSKVDGEKTKEKNK